jgi:transposase
MRRRWAVGSVVFAALIAILIGVAAGAVLTRPHARSGGTAAPPSTCGTWGNVTSANRENQLNFLAGVAALPTGDAWAAGYYVSNGTHLQTLIERNTDGAWSIVASPNPKYNQVSDGGCILGGKEVAMRPIEIRTLSPAAGGELDAWYRSTRQVRLRTRAQMVLLAAEQHLTAAAIAAIVRESEETVRRWLQRYQAEGREGLRDQHRGGRPATVTDAYRQQLLAAVRRRPRSLGQPYSLWTLQRLADYLAEQTGIRVGYETVRLHLKAADIVLSRPQHTSSSPDPEYAVKKTRAVKLA